MNTDEYKVWQDDVMIHTQTLKTIINDRMILKEKIIEHLQNFFSWEEIDFTQNFNKITLKYEYNHDPIIRADSLDGLNMDMIITHNYDQELGHGVVIELYPFGVDSIGEED